MNVSDGGKQPFMRNTRWDGEDKSMVTDKGLQKDLKVCWKITMSIQSA